MSDEYKIGTTASGTREHVPMRDNRPGISEGSEKQPTYYAKDGVVFKSPVERKRPDGGMNITIGFPVCTMHEAVGDDAAETVAQLMNAGEAALGISQSDTR